MERRASRTLDPGRRSSTSPFPPPVFNFHSAVYVISGVGGAVIRTHADAAYYLGGGWSVRGVGDVDGVDD